MELPVNPSAIVELLRSWFFAKDRSIVMANDTFIEAEDNTTSPGNPTTNRSRLFYQLANPPPGRGWYSLNELGNKYQFSGDVASWQAACSLFQALPGLRGFWPMSAFDGSGNASDLSGQARELTYNGNPLYNVDNLAPYIKFDGVGDHLHRSDEAGLDIIGNESYVSNPGLSLGGWFWFDGLGSNEDAISKYGVAGARSWLLRKTNGNKAQLFISTDGTNTFNASSSNTINSANTWNFMVGRFIGSTEVSVWLNQTKTTETAGIGATIFNSGTVFQICGRNRGGALMTGRASMCFLCASALSDSIINNLYQQTRTLYGV